MEKGIGSVAGGNGQAAGARFGIIAAVNP